MLENSGQDGIQGEDRDNAKKEKVVVPIQN